MSPTVSLHSVPAGLPSGQLHTILLWDALNVVLAGTVSTISTFVAAVGPSLKATISWKMVSGSVMTRKKASPNLVIRRSGGGNAVLVEVLIVVETIVRIAHGVTTQKAPVRDRVLPGSCEGTRKV